MAAALAGRKYPVLLIDLDPQANATSALGIEPATVDGGTYAHLAGGEVERAELRRMVCQSCAPGLDVRPAGPDLYAIDLELAKVQGQATTASPTPCAPLPTPTRWCSSTARPPGGADAQRAVRGILGAGADAV